MSKPSADSDPTNGATRRSGPEPGFEEIPLELSKVPSLELGLADAARRYQIFIEIAGESLRPLKGAVIFRDHLAMMSFINRASSLHKAIVSAVESSNP